MHTLIHTKWGQFKYKNILNDQVIKKPASPGVQFCAIPNKLLLHSFKTVCKGLQ